MYRELTAEGIKVRIVTDVFHNGTLKTGPIPPELDHLRQMALEVLFKIKRKKGDQWLTYAPYSYRCVTSNKGNSSAYWTIQLPKVFYCRACFNQRRMCLLYSERVRYPPPAFAILGAR